MTNRITADRLLQIGLGFQASKTLLSAVELGVFTELAKAPADLATLSSQLGLHERSARDFLDALVALKTITRENGLYRNTPETDLFLDRAKPGYAGAILEIANTRHYPAWGSLTRTLKTGLPDSNTVPSGDTFEPVHADLDRLRSFLSAMSALSADAAQVIAARFPWNKYRTFADIGTAQGMMPVTLGRAHGHLKGVGFDLPPAGPVFEEFVAKHGLSERIKFQGGNFFVDPLPRADVIIMGHILHDWNLPQKRALLAKAYNALPKGGSLIVYEALIDDERRENAAGLLMSLNMMLVTPGGFDFTGADCQAWMREAGFLLIEVTALGGANSMITSVK